MTLDEFRKEADAIVENYIDDMLWYFQEYRDELKITDMAMILSDAYRNLAFKVAEELEEEVE